MSVQKFYITLFIAAAILQCVYCKKTEHVSITNNDFEDTSESINSWNTWEPDSKKAGLNWTPMEDPQEFHDDKTAKHKTRAEKGQSQGKARAGEPLIDPNFNFGDLRKTVFKYGKYLFDFVTGSHSTFGLRTFFPDSPFSSTFEKRSSSSWARTGEGRGAIDWLARLIGVEGKTLGEFLREYQVHVLYDLVFTFFKWIFFLYAGLLIP